MINLATVLLMLINVCSCSSLCVVADSDILVHPVSFMARLLMIDTGGIIVGGTHI